MNQENTMDTPYMTDTLQQLRKSNVARQIEWTNGQPDILSLEYRGNEFAGEAGEVCNVVKKLARERLGIPGSRDTVEHLAEELADTIICADLIAQKEGIDLREAIITKFNRTSSSVGLNTFFGPYVIGGVEL
jgi:NTP pyrophosphatase (non-canonical NTP hydrolase)